MRPTAAPSLVAPHPRDPLHDHCSTTGTHVLPNCPRTKIKSNMFIRAVAVHVGALKALAAAPASPEQHSSAIAVYYAAIASALVFHGRKVTRNPWPHLDASFARLADEPWIGGELADLFARASRLCRHNRAGSGFTPRDSLQQEGAGHQ